MTYSQTKFVSIFFVVVAVEKWNEKEFDWIDVLSS